MSANNYHYITKLSDGRYAVNMGFMSNPDPPTIDGSTQIFNDLQSAMEYAHKHPTEYSAVLDIFPKPEEKIVVKPAARNGYTMIQCNDDPEESIFIPDARINDLILQLQERAKVIQWAQERNIPVVRRYNTSISVDHMKSGSTANFHRWHWVVRNDRVFFVDHNGVEKLAGDLRPEIFNKEGYVLCNEKGEAI